MKLGNIAPNIRRCVHFKHVTNKSVSVTQVMLCCVSTCDLEGAVYCVETLAKVAGVGAHEQCGHSGWWPGVHHCLLPTSSSNTTPAPAVVTLSVVTHTPTCPHTASLAPDLSLQYVSHYVTVLSRSRDAREGRRAVCCQLERDSHTLCHVIIAPPSPPHHCLTLPI